MANGHDTCTHTAHNALCTNCGNYLQAFGNRVFSICKFLFRNWTHRLDQCTAFIFGQSEREGETKTLLLMCNELDSRCQQTKWDILLGCQTEWAWFHTNRFELRMANGRWNEWLIEYADRRYAELHFQSSASCYCFEGMCATKKARIEQFFYFGMVFARAELEFELAHTRRTVLHWTCMFGNGGNGFELILVAHFMRQRLWWWNGCVRAWRMVCRAAVCMHHVTNLNKIAIWK